MLSLTLDVHHVSWQINYEFTCYSQYFGFNVSVFKGYVFVLNLINGEHEVVRGSMY